jgi:hypothetical protein
MRRRADNFAICWMIVLAILVACMLAGWPVPIADLFAR